MKHLIIEANCIFDYEEENNINVPKCCKYGIGNVSVNCLSYQKETNRVCPYLVFGTAKSSLALVDKNGEVVNAVSFWGDLRLSEEEWNLKEEKWITRCNDILKTISENLLDE